MLDNHKVVYLAILRNFRIFLFKKFVIELILLTLHNVRINFVVYFCLNHDSVPPMEL